MEAMAVHESTQPYPGKAFAFDPRMIGEFRKMPNITINEPDLAPAAA